MARLPPSQMLLEAKKKTLTQNWLVSAFKAGLVLSRNVLAAAWACAPVSRASVAVY